MENGKQRKASASWVGDAIAVGVLLITVAVLGMSGREQAIELDTERVLPEAFGLDGANQQLNANSDDDPHGNIRGEIRVEQLRAQSQRLQREAHTATNKREET